MLEKQEIRNQLKKIIEHVGEDNEIGKGLKDVDNTVIIISTAFIAAGFVIFSIKANDNQYSSVSLVISLVCLAATILFSLWHKLRFPIRLRLYREKRSQLSELYADGFYEYLNHIYKPAIRSSYDKALAMGDIKEARDIDSVLLPDSTFVHNVMTTSLMGHLTLIESKFIEKPLSEKYSRLKFIVDLLARKYRYQIFAVGLLSLVIAFALALL